MTNLYKCFFAYFERGQKQEFYLQDVAASPKQAVDRLSSKAQARLPGKTLFLVGVSRKEGRIWVEVEEQARVCVN